MIDCALCRALLYSTYLWIFCHQASSTKGIACRRISQHGCRQFVKGRRSAASREPVSRSRCSTGFASPSSFNPRSDMFATPANAKLPVFVSSLSSTGGRKAARRLPVPLVEVRGSVCFPSGSLCVHKVLYKVVRWRAGLAWLLVASGSPMAMGASQARAQAFKELSSTDGRRRPVSTDSGGEPSPWTTKGAGLTAWMLWSFIFLLTVTIRYSLINSFIQ